MPKIFILYELAIPKTNDMPIRIELNPPGPKSTVI